MVSYEELKAIERFADELRNNLPIPQDKSSLAQELKAIIYQHFWDVIATLENQYRTEFQLYAKDLEVNYAKKS